MANSKFSSMVLLVLNLVRNAIIFIDSLIIGIYGTVQVKNFILSVSNKQLLGSNDFVYLIAGFLSIASFILCIYLIVKTVIQISDYMMFMRADNYFFGIALDYGFTSYFTTILGILWLGSLNIVAISLINSGKATEGWVIPVIGVVVWIFSVYAFLPKRKENHNDFNNIIYKNDVFSHANSGSSSNNSSTFDFGFPTGDFAEENKSAFEYTEQLGYEVEDEEAAIAAARAEEKTVEITQSAPVKKKLSFNIPTFGKTEKEETPAEEKKEEPKTPNAMFASSHVVPGAASFNAPSAPAPAAPVTSTPAAPAFTAPSAPVEPEAKAPEAPAFTSSELTADGIPVDLYYKPSAHSEPAAAEEETSAVSEPAAFTAPAAPIEAAAPVAPAAQTVPTPSFTAPVEPIVPTVPSAPAEPVETNAEGIPTNLYYTAPAKPEAEKEEEKPASTVYTPSYNPASNSTHVVHQSLVDPSPTVKKPTGEHTVIEDIKPEKPAKPAKAAKPAKPKKEPKKKDESTFIVYTDTFVNRKQK